MKREIIPAWEELERHKRIIPEINPAAVIAMLGIKMVGEEIQQSILDVLQKEYNLSEGKFCALVVLHQHSETGIAPSDLAEKVGVTRATISKILPPHYLRVTRLMEKLSEPEQKELIYLLKKLAL